MKTILLLIAFFAVVLYESRPTLKLNPFQLTFENPLSAIGFLLVMVGVALISYETRTQAYDKGVNAASEVCAELLAEREHLTK